MNNQFNARLENTELFETIISINELNTESIKQAKEIFDNYKNSKIIVSSNFSDTRWQFCDEYSNVGMIFRIPKFIYKRHYEPIIGLSLNECLEYIKSYILLQLGKNVLETLRDVLNDIKKVFSSEIHLIYSQHIKLRHPSKVLDFFDILPAINIEQKEIIIESLINLTEVFQVINYSEQRELASFQSYLKFDKYINEYWSCVISTEQRLFFYPVYLWWKITAIIPLRPREFLLTPRNCLTITDDKFYITLKRNTLKGGSGRVHYNISLDYTNVTYQIPKSLFNIIDLYIKTTDGYSGNVIDTLFRTEAHYAYFNQTTRINNRFYTYVNLSTCLKTFYQDVLIGRYNLNILNKNSNAKIEHYNNNYIEFIHLGDTRHIAMINIIAEGGSPTIAMQLAGHSSIEMSSHYYTNISNMIECKTYQRYRDLTSGNEDFTFGINHYQTINLNKYVDLGDGNKCFSSNFANGEINDCIKVISETGQIGNCRSCTYYRNNNMKYFLQDEQLYKSLIEKDCQYLNSILKRYRRGIGYDEDIKEAFMQLASSTIQYKNYYMQKLITNAEGIEDGKTEEDSI